MPYCLSVLVYRHLTMPCVQRIERSENFRLCRDIFASRISEQGAEPKKIILSAVVRQVDQVCASFRLAVLALSPGETFFQQLGNFPRGHMAH